MILSKRCPKVKQAPGSNSASICAYRHGIGKPMVMNERQKIPALADKKTWGLSSQARGILAI